METNTISKNSKIKSMGSKIASWAKSLTWSEWINFFIWIFTFLLLIAIIVVASLEKDIKQVHNLSTYSNIMAGLILPFSIFLCGSIIHISIIKYNQKKKGKK